MPATAKQDGAPAAPADGDAHPYKFFLGDLDDGTVETLDFLATEPLPRFRDRAPGTGPVLAPLYIPVPRQWGVHDLANEIVDLLEGQAGESDVLVFRAHGTEGEGMLEQMRDSYLLERAGRRVWLLHLEEGQPRLTDVATGKRPLGRDQETECVNMLRECELTSYARLPGVYLEGSETFHYVGPNKKHYRAFFRVGSILRSLEAVDSMCFWLTPLIRHADMLLLDSATILSVGLRSADYLHEAGVREGTRLGVEALRRYREEEITLAPRLERLGGRSGAQLVFLESVSSTGGLVEYVRETCGEHLGFEVTPVPMFSTTAVAEATAINPLCHIGEASNALAEPCELCEQGSQRVNLLPASYTLEVAAAVDTTTITKKDAERGKKYLEDYAGTDCVSLHRTQPDSDRHHMIYIDAGELLDSSRRFKARLRKQLEGLEGQPGAILTPTHDAGRKLGEYVRGRLQVPLLHREDTALPNTAEEVNDLPEAWISSLKSHPLLLLIDDVVITGTRLRRYLNSLGPLFAAVPGLQIVYLVGIARPEHRDALTSVPQMLRGRGVFKAAEEIVLPHWGQVHCPWCRELDEIDALRREGVPLEGALLDRYELLRDTRRGIRGNEALLSWEGTGMNGLPCSIFGDGSLSEMFLSVAASLQSLRNDGRLVEEFRPPLAKVLHPTETFEQRFFEYRIQLLIVRGCRSHDLNTPLVQRDLNAMLSRRLAGDREPSEREPCRIDGEVREQRAELVLAAAQGKLPHEWLQRRGDDEREKAWIEQVLNEGDSTICRFLRGAIDRA